MKTEGRIIMTIFYLFYMIASLLIMSKGLFLITTGVLLGHLGLWVIEIMELKDEVRDNGD